MKLPGRARISSGIDLIVWSTLASCDGKHLLPAIDAVLFNQHWPSVDRIYGRWIAFCVGAESIVKGAFGLKGYRLKNFGATHPWCKRLGMSARRAKIVQSAIERLAKLRNRDAHEYMAGVRNSDFQLVEAPFVPALNYILDSMNHEIASPE